MTRLDIAFAEASKLPPKEQEALANWILEEIASGRKWDALYATSQEILSRLADESLNDYHAGRTEPLDPDAL